MLDDLVEVIETLKGRMQEHRADLQSYEARTRVALIDPLLRALGWDVADPALVTPEYQVEGGKVDYGLRVGDRRPAVFVEAKKLGEPLPVHREQMVRYANMAGVAYAALTDGNRWELYTVFTPEPLSLDERRILDISIAELPAHQCALKLLLLWRCNMAAAAPTEAAVPLFAISQSLSPPAGPVVPPTPPSLEAGWTTLAEFQARGGTKPPTVIRFPDGKEHQIATWKGLLVQVAEWLIGKGQLTAAICPIKMGKIRYLVHTQAIHSEGTPFKAGATLSNGLFLETNLSAGGVVQCSRSLLEHMGQSPSTVHFDTG